MEYRVVVGGTLDVFTERVNRLLAEGWILQGGIAVAVHQGAATYIQAISKEYSSRG